MGAGRCAMTNVGQFRHPRLLPRTGGGAVRGVQAINEPRPGALSREKLEEDSSKRIGHSMCGVCPQSVKISSR